MSGTIPVIVDNGTVTRTPAPTLTAAFTSPAANATVRGTTTIGISATGSTAATRTFRLSIDGTVVSTQRVTGTTAAYTRSTTAVPDGSHTLRLVVIDGAGRHVNRHQHGDRLQHHHAGADGHRQRSLGHRNTYTMSVNGRVIGTQTVSSTGPVSTPWNTTTAAGGTHVLPVTVTDATGNTGAAKVTVTVRNQQWAL